MKNLGLFLVALTLIVSLMTTSCGSNESVLSSEDSAPALNEESQSDLTYDTSGSGDVGGK